MCTFGLSGCRVKPPAAFGANTPKITERTKWWREKEKKREIVGSPLFRAPNGVVLFVLFSSCCFFFSKKECQKTESASAFMSARPRIKPGLAQDETNTLQTKSKVCSFGSPNLVNTLCTGKPSPCSLHPSARQVREVPCTMRPVALQQPLSQRHSSGWPYRWLLSCSRHWTPCLSHLSKFEQTENVEKRDTRTW